MYYRRKGNKIIIEGTERGKTKLIWTVSDPEKLLAALMEKPSFFTKEKTIKIVEKIARLDLKASKVNPTIQKVRPIEIKRSPKKDGLERINTEEREGKSIAAVEISEEMNEKLRELSK